MKAFRGLVASICGLLISFAQAQAAEFTGKCTRVVDGDTIVVAHDDVLVKVRLNGIDCPEKSQPYGTEAKQLTSSLALGKDVHVNYNQTDRYGRTLGDVVLPDGSMLNQDLVRDGYAWRYRQYSHSALLESLEQAARAARAGLWQEPDPTPPWEYRHSSRRVN